MRNKFVAGIIILAVLIAAAAVFLFSSLDSLIKAAVETYGSEITATDVTLDKVVISATSGEGGLYGLTMGNLEGFETDHALKLGEVFLVIDTASLAEDTVTVKEIRIIAPEITYEIGADGSNLDAIQKNVDSYLGAGGGKDDTAPSEDGGKKLVIDDLVIKGGKVNVSASFLGGKTMTTPLPDLHLTDIGKEDDGATPGEVAKEVIGAIKESAGKAVATLDLGAVADTVEKGLSGAKDALSEGAGSAGDALSEGAGKAGDALKGLLGN